MLPTTAPVIGSIPLLVTDRHHREKGCHQNGNTGSQTVQSVCKVHTIDRTDHRHRTEAELQAIRYPRYIPPENGISMVSGICCHLHQIIGKNTLSL